MVSMMPQLCAGCALGAAGAAASCCSGRVSGKMGEREEKSGTGREGDEAGGRYRVGAMSSGADAVVWSCAGSDGCHGSEDGGRWVEQHQRLLLKDLGGRFMHKAERAKKLPARRVSKPDLGHEADQAKLLRPCWSFQKFKNGIRSGSSGSWGGQAWRGIALGRDCALRLQDGP